MPAFKKLTKDEVNALARAHLSRQGLAEYIEHLKRLRPGDWGRIELAPGEEQRVVKRRASIAASSLGMKLRWKRLPDTSELVFLILPRDGGRARTA